MTLRLEAVGFACVLLASLASTACGGRTFGTGSAGAGSDGAGPGAGDAGGPEAFTPAQVAAAHDACALPHGPLVSPATVGDLRALLTGSWFLCSTEMTYAGVDYDSITYDADGRWAYLLPDARGGLVRGVGVESVGTYTISDNPDAGEGDPVRTGGPVYMDYPTGGMNGYFVAFETGPQRMNVLIGTAGTTQWFIRLAAP
jgi:hypothetical protein